MKKIFAGFGILMIFAVGCGPTQATKSATPAPSPNSVTLAAPMPTKTASKVIEQDIMVGDKFLSSGDGKAVFQRFKKQKSRRVIHEIKKGLFMGGEK